MPEQLPKGWVATALGEIVRPGRPRVSPREYPELPYIGLEHVESQTMRLLGKGDASAIRSSSILFEKGDLLYGKMRPYLNKIWVADFSGLCSAEFLVFPAAEEANNSFLALRLNADDFVNFANQQVSGDRPRVDFKGLSSFAIRLPPLSEQGRIVATLNKALARMYASESATHRGSERLAKYRAAILRSAVSGDLTRVWHSTKPADNTDGQLLFNTADETGEQLLERILASGRTNWEESELQRRRKSGKPLDDDNWKADYREPEPIDSTDLSPLPEGWTYAAVDQVGFVQLGRQRSPENHQGEFMRPYLRVANVFEDKIDLRDVKRMNFSPAEFDSFHLEKGDILLNEGQSLELIGRPAMYRGEVEGACFQNTLIRFRAYEPLNPAYALIVFRAYFHSGRFQQIAKWSTNIAHLGARRFSRLEFPLPSLVEQNEIVREVEHRFSAAARLSKTLSLQLERARVTRQSLLHDAFEGHLIPQNSKDEPAIQLLNRIRTRWEEEDSKPRAKRMAKSQLTTHLRPLLDVLREYKKPVAVEVLFRDSGYEAVFKGSDEQQDVVDAFYKELRKLTEPPSKLVEYRDSKQKVTLTALP